MILNKKDLNSINFYERLNLLIANEACQEGKDYVAYGQAHNYTLAELADKAKEYSSIGPDWVLWVMDKIFENSDEDVVNYLLKAGIDNRYRIAAMYYFKYPKIHKKSEKFLKSLFLSSDREDGKEILPEIEKRFKNGKLKSIRDEH